MSTEFFKKIFKKIAQLICVCFVFLSCAHAISIQNATYLNVSKTFYYLVSDDLHVQATTHETLLQGGAGYLLSDNGREYVAYHVYSSLKQAQRIQNGLSKPSKIIQKGRQRLCFNTQKEKRDMRCVQAVLACLDGYMQVLDAEITRLEIGATQQSSKRILKTLYKQLKYLDGEYATILPSLQPFVYQTSTLLEASLAGTVYAKDLRYAMCLLSEGYLQLCSEYSI